MALSTNRFHTVPRPKGVSSRYSLVVVDGNGKPHLPLTRFYQEALCGLSDGAARTYLDSLLPFFSYLATDDWRRHREDHWDSEPEAVQECVRDYLITCLACKVQRRDTYERVSLTARSPSTVRVFLAALKQFYSVARRAKWYVYANPFIDPVVRLIQEIEEEDRRTAGMRPRLPQKSGVEEPLGPRPSDNYFRLGREKWEVHPIDDPTLHKRLIKGFTSARFCLRDQIVVRMAYETGARISEILGLTVGDWRKRGCNVEALAFSKGSRGKRVKVLRFYSKTAQMLRQYINTDRAQLDQAHQRLEQLPESAPLFLSERHNPYSYEAFRPHWKTLCQAAHIKLNIHGLRHWYVTQAMREVALTANSSEGVTLGKEELVRYMAWRSPETLAAYEHYFTGQRWSKTHDSLHKRLYGGVKKYLEEQGELTEPQSPLPFPGTEKVPARSTSSEQQDSGWGDLLALGRGKGN